MAAIDDVLKYLTTNEIKWVDLQFFGIDGTMHRTTISKNDLEESTFTKGISGADLSEVYGKSEQGELVLLPDPDTIARVPWEQSTVRLICDVIAIPSGEKFLKNPRYMLERMETNLSALGIKNALIGTEVEFYIFENITTDRTSVGRGAGTILDSRESYWSPSPMAGKKSGAYTASPVDSLYPARIQIANALEEGFGMEVVAHHHGRSQTSQQCMEFRERNPKNAADALSTLKQVTKNLTLVANAISCFMPMPVEGEKGSTLSIHQSMWKTGEANAFYDSSDEYAQLSQTARYYIGGLLEHAPALCIFTNPTTNSYKRLAADPKVLGWSKSDRTAAVQVPFKKKNDKEGKRVAYTLSDPSVNPYLAYAAVIAAGIDGIKSKIDCGDPLEQGEKKKKPKDVPDSLKAAVGALENDSKFLKGVFSAEILGDYLNLKLAEHRESMKTVPAWEMNKYFNV